MAEITSPKRLRLPDGSTATRGPGPAAGDGPGLEALAGNTTTPGGQG